MTIETEFEKAVSNKMSDAKVIALVKTYRKKIEESGFAQNTRFCKMSRINMIVKRLYGEHLYAEVLKFNVPDRTEKKAQIQARNKFNMERLENREEFTYDEITDAIDTLKSSNDYYKLVMCIMLATGRRSTEVIARGNFEHSELAHHILFSGQLKTGGDKRESYDIPAIGITPQVLIQMVAKIRSIKDYSNATNAFIASRTNAYVNRAIRSALEKDVTSETIRCIYAYIAYRLYGNPRISEAMYCAKILGHKGAPNVFINNYNRVYVSGIEE